MTRRLSHRRRQSPAPRRYDAAVTDQVSTPSDLLLEHTIQFRVRTYEVDENGHVNNAVYLNWAENLTADHAESAGFGRRWTQDRGGAWVVRRHEVTYRLPAVRDDEIVATVRVEALGGVRGVRRTWIRRATDGTELAEIVSEWVWVRVADGRPARIPGELLGRYRALLD
jgi:acyl-CoA thioester hydrolase